MPATRQWSSKLVVEPHCSCGPESTPSDPTGYWRGLPPLWRPRKVRHFRHAGRLYPMRGSMQMILLTTWSGYLAKWTLPSHPGVSPMWNSLARNSSRSFSDPSASCQPEQALSRVGFYCWLPANAYILYQYFLWKRINFRQILPTIGKFVVLFHDHKPL